MILHAEIAEFWESKKSGERFAFPIFFCCLNYTMSRSDAKHVWEQSPEKAIRSHPDTHCRVRK